LCSLSHMSMSREGSKGLLFDGQHMQKACLTSAFCLP
jgi:hypothetical protein